MTAEVFHTTLGRCHQIQIKADNKAFINVEFVAKIPIYVYLNMAGQFTHTSSKTKIDVKTQQRLYIDVIMQFDYPMVLQCQAQL